MSAVNFGIEPIGAVYFGDGRPTDAGETDFGRGRFPPTPRTVQGLIRTALLRSVQGLDLRVNKQRIRELVGPPDHLPADWQIFGPWLAQWEETDDGIVNVNPWVPIPRYVIETKSGRLESLKLIKDNDIRSDVSMFDNPISLCGSKEWKSNLNGYISANALFDLLNGTPPNSVSQEISKNDPPFFVTREAQTGLRITPGTEVAEPGMLYTFNYFRMQQGSGLIAGFSGTHDSDIDINVLKREVTSLGGRNKLARLLEIKDWHPTFTKIRNGQHLPNEPVDGQQFWVFSVTPVQMKCPWKPFCCGAEGSNEYRFGESVARVLSAVVGKRESIGGFSLARGASARSAQYLKAGSAWLIEVNGGSVNERRELLHNIHNHSVLGNNKNENGFGFGHAFVANPLI